MKSRIGKIEQFGFDQPEEPDLFGHLAVLARSDTSFTNEHLLTLVDGLPTLLAFWDADLKCRFANRAYSLWFGVDHRQIPGMTMAELVGEQLFADNKEMINAALRGERQDFERSMLCADGVLRNTMVTYLPSIIDNETTGFVAHIVDVSRLKMAEDALRDEVGKHQNTIDALADAVDKISAFETVFRMTLRLNGQIPWSTSADGSFTYVNQFWEDDWARLTGHRPPGSLARNIAEIVHVDDRSRARANALRYISTATAGDDRYRIVDASGAVRWLRVRIAPDFNAAGTVKQWLGTVEDVDDLVRAEDRARNIDAAYKYTIELNGQIPWTAPADGSLFTVSEDWQKHWHALSGLPTVLTLQNHVRAFTHPDDIERITRDTVDRMAAGLPLDHRHRLRGPEGGYRWWRSRAAPSRDEQGAIGTWYGTLEDIHAEVVEEERRQALDITYRLTVELSGKIPWTTTADGVLFSVGEDAAGRWAALTGRPASETVAAYRAAAVHPLDLDRIGVIRDEAINAGHPMDYRYRLRMVDGDYRWWHSRASPLLDLQGNVVRWYGTLEDIHDQVLNEERVQQLEAAVGHFARLAAMNSLASVLAHELNQPLAAVANYVEGARRLLALGDPDKLADIDKALEAAVASNMRSARIIRSLRNMVAKGAVNRRQEGLASVINDACLLALPDAAVQGVEYIIRIEPGLTTIHVDRVQFKQVLINLLRNSLDALEASAVRKITIEAKRRAGAVEISVADTGAGVAADRVDKLFEAFNSTKADGLGIGLSISRTIVEANGGKISHAPVPGGGTCFTITIPDLC